MLDGQAPTVGARTLGKAQTNVENPAIQAG
jgi:hypothetical protein